MPHLKTDGHGGDSDSSHLSPFPPVFLLPFPPQLFLKELQQWQGQVDETNALADKLLTLYAHDDTHKVTQVNDNMTTTWTHISKRYFTCKSTGTELPVLSVTLTPRVSLQGLGQGGGPGGSSEAAAAVLPRPGEVPQLADGGGDHLQRPNRRHQQGEAAGAAGGQKPAGAVEGRTLTRWFPQKLTRGE